jgi:hypothetical protein
VEHAFEKSRKIVGGKRREDPLFSMEWVLPKRAAPPVPVRSAIVPV